MAQAQRGTGKRIDGQGSNWIRRSTRWAIYARDEGRCVYCTANLAIGRRATLDHVGGQGFTGANAPSNLVTACKGCNDAKGELSLVAWARVLARANRSAGSVETILARVRNALDTPIDRARGRVLAAMEGTSGYREAIRSLVPSAPKAHTPAAPSYLTLTGPMPGRHRQKPCQLARARKSAWLGPGRLVKPLGCQQSSAP